MPGARLRSFRLGDRSELLVEHLLAGFAFTTRVPRQEDIGIDFMCSLIYGEGEHLLKAGPFFTVQAKSSPQEIAYKEPYELEWIRNQENPILICVADRGATAMDVYSTWNLLCGIHGGAKGGTVAPDCIKLIPGATSEKWPGVRDPQDGTLEIQLGKPIIRVSHEDIRDRDKTANIAQIVGDWIALDRMNIVNRHAGLYWVGGPVEYETGKRLGQAGKVAFYWHPQNLDKCENSFALAATGLWQILHHSQISQRADVTKPPWPDKIRNLREILIW